MELREVRVRVAVLQWLLGVCWGCVSVLPTPEWAPVEGGTADRTVVSLGYGGERSTSHRIEALAVSLTCNVGT